MTGSIKKHESTMIAPELLLAAYATGYFPMADPSDGNIRWYSPDPRAIISLDTFKISRSLHQTIKKKLFSIRINTTFEQVIRSCAKREETWISEEIIQSYLELFRLGYAHSVESWKEEKLVGGLYGVALGGAFFGESMFSTTRDASKVSLVSLVGRMKIRGFTLLDTQFLTPHIATLGASEIPRREYLLILNSAISKKVSFL